MNAFASRAKGASTMAVMMLSPKSSRREMVEGNRLITSGKRASICSESVIQSARADLFENACCVVTPTSTTPLDAATRVEELWRSVGGRVLRLAPDVHDELVSRSSHLPHLIAAHLASYVLDSSFPAEQSRLCANGFKDSTRIASGSPEMWRDIISMNRVQAGRALQDFIRKLQDFSAVLEKDDPALIEEFFRAAKMKRDHWTTQCASNSPE